MYRETIAERILTLVTNRECAATIVGDLIQSNTSCASFWFAIGSIVLHGIDRHVLADVVAALVLQFLLPLTAYLPAKYYLGRSMISSDVWHYGSLAGFFFTQVLVGLWIARRNRKRAVFVCLLLVTVNCGLGLRMAAWSLPVVLGTMLARRLHRTSRPRSA